MKAVNVPFSYKISEQLDINYVVASSKIVCFVSETLQYFSRILKPCLENLPSPGITTPNTSFPLSLSSTRGV